MKRFLKLFRLEREERLPALVMLLFFVALTTVFVIHYYPYFSDFSYKGGNPFFRHFRVSGYDSFLYIITSRWSTFHTIVFRHPLLVFMLFPFHVLNHWLYLGTGLNCVQFVIAVPLLFSALYAFIFLLRIFRHVLEMGLWESRLLAAMTFSFAHIMLAVFVPDHFILSMFLLTLTLYVAGMRMKNKAAFSAGEAFWLTLLTGGVTLTNGVKTILASLFVNGRGVFKVRFLLIGIVLPFVLLTAISNLTYEHITRHEEVARSEQGFLKWSDMTTPRLKSIWHNQFGESIQLHEKDLLVDSQFGRELFAPYSNAWNHVVEILLILLFLAGIWCGRKSRYLWLCLAWVAFDMTMHLGFGFALREIYLMTAHWAFVIPIAIAFLLKGSSRWRKPLVALIGGLTLFLYIYNVSLIMSYFVS